jgi:histone H3/H4|tara:strand:+ start:4769 stop:5086 length:318 start_codon:yes stop_codon:yes gene_type:complete
MSTQQSSKTKRKRRASTNAIREIKKEQGKTHNIIPVAPFNRLTQEIAQGFKTDMRFKGEAHKALHAGAESYLVEVFQAANKVAIHGGRETVQAKDVKLVMELSSN